MSRQVVLDTETTGLEPTEGHRIIEIGCVELVDRRLSDRRYHQYLCPDRDIDEGAIEVHGITWEFLQDSPRFGDIVEEFLAFVRGAELIIHNAPFDVGFVNQELRLLGPEWGQLEEQCAIADTLALARDLHPGQKNSLDALCRRYHVDNSQRKLHGALLDAEILADVYLAMTGGQGDLLLDGAAAHARTKKRRRWVGKRPRLRLIQPNGYEVAEHQRILANLDKASGGRCVWRRLERELSAR